MTIGEALERAEQLRPNCRIETETRLQWLREADALLRTKLFDRTAAGAQLPGVGKPYSVCQYHRFTPLPAPLRPAAGWVVLPQLKRMS